MLVKLIEFLLIAFIIMNLYSCFKSILSIRKLEKKFKEKEKQLNEIIEKSSFPNFLFMPPDDF